MLRRFLYGFVSILIVLTLCITVFIRNQIPQRNGAIPSSQIENSVDVVFDEFGIPHIDASSEEDAYFALGKIHAQDRWFQMEIMRRTAKGELAEIVGQKALESDKFFRTIGLYKLSQK